MESTEMKMPIIEEGTEKADLQAAPEMTEAPVDDKAVIAMVEEVEQKVILEVEKAEAAAKLEFAQAA